LNRIRFGLSGSWVRSTPGRAGLESDDAVRDKNIDGKSTITAATAISASLILCEVGQFILGSGHNLIKISVIIFIR
jgi:hypothetical protein